MGEGSFVCAAGSCFCVVLLGFVTFCVIISAYCNLLPNEQMLVKDAQGKWVVNGPATYQFNPFHDRERREATLIDYLGYAVVQEQLTGDIRIVEGPTLLFLGAYDELVSLMPKVVLAKNEYVKLVDQSTGIERVLAGPQQVVPRAIESIPEGKMQAVMVDTETAVLVQNKVTGVQRLVTEFGAFIPTADEIVVEERMLVRVLPHEAVTVRDVHGITTVYKGDANEANDDGVAFFVPPFGMVVKMYWTSFDDWGTPLTEPGSGEGPVYISLLAAAAETAQPLCTDCGPQEHQCYHCGNDVDGCACNGRGYCNACDSAEGLRGACCSRGQDDDPDECKEVDYNSFRHGGSYHECVIVPTVREGSCQPWCVQHTATWSDKCGWASLACSVCPECQASTSSSGGAGSCDSTFGELIGSNVQRVSVSGATEADLDQQCCASCNSEPLCTFWVRQSSRRRRESKTCWLRNGAIGEPMSSNSRRGGRKILGGGALIVRSGGCMVDSTGCVTSPNYPNSYGNSEFCDISAGGSLRVVAFQTEAGYDSLFVNGAAYNGADGSRLNGVTPTQPIVWSSDGGTTMSGWKICAAGTVSSSEMPEGTFPVTHIDLRARKAKFKFPVRTSDNVPLELEGTIFWQVLDVDKMVNATSDPLGDLWYHARSSMIQAVSMSSLGTFMSSFNQIVLDAFVLDAQDGFYDARGIEVQQIELTSYSAADVDTVNTLRDIIKETTNRLVQLEVGEGENEARQEAISGQVMIEGKRTALITTQRNNSRMAAQTKGVLEGRKPATAIASFLDGITTLPGGMQANLDLYQEHAAQEHSRKSLHQLATGNASLYVATDTVNLELRVKAAGAPETETPAARRADDAAANGTASAGDAAGAPENTISATGAQERRMSAEVEEDDFHVLAAPSAAVADAAEHVLGRASRSEL